MLRGVEPQPVLLRRHDDRHAVVDGPHEGIGEPVADGRVLGPTPA